MKHLRLFELLNDYQNVQSSEGGIALPNVSFIKETRKVFYTPKSKLMVCTYHSPSADEAVHLFNENAFLVNTGTGQFHAIEKMYINDVEVEINPYHVFGSEGEYVVKYKLYEMPETEMPTGELIKGSYINTELFAANEEGDAYLTKVELPSNCCCIGGYAFAGQVNLTGDFVIDESVKLVGQGFLYNVPADLYINSKFIEQEYDVIGPVFEGCMAKNLYIGDNVIEFGWANEYGEINEEQSLLSLSIENLYFGKNIKKVNFPYFNSTLQNIYLPNIESLFNIEWVYFLYTGYLFTGRNIYIDNNSLYEIEDLVIPNGATKVYEKLFDNYDLNNNLKSVIIPDSVTEIERYAFQECPLLTSVTIGSGVTSIGNGAFRNCSSLTSVYCKATTPPKFNYTGYHPFAGIQENCKFYVPMESVDAYKTNEDWSTYADNIEGYNF